MDFGLRGKDKMAIFITPGGRERIQGWDGHHHRHGGEREKHRKYSWIIENKTKPIVSYRPKYTIPPLGQFTLIY